MLQKKKIFNGRSLLKSTVTTVISELAPRSHHAACFPAIPAITREIHTCASIHVHVFVVPILTEPCSAYAFVVETL